MTVVAAWKEGNTPFLLGDFMVTSEPKDFIGDHYNLPTRDDLERKLPKELGVKIQRPCQKIYRVSDTLAIGFSGCIAPAKKVIEKILRIYQNRKPCLDDFKHHLCSVDIYTKGNNCFLIVGWLIDRENQYCFKWDSRFPEQFSIKNKFIIGSGEKDFNEAFSPAFFIGERPIENALGRSALILKDEVLYGTNLIKRYGGGIELIYFDGKTFKVLDNVLYIFLQAEETDKEGELKLVSPNRFLKFAKRDKIIEVMAVLPNENSVGTQDRDPSENANHKMFYIPPVTMKDEESFSADTNLPFLSDHYCICVDFKLSYNIPKLAENRFILQSMIVAYPELYRSKYIDISNEGDKEGFALNNNFFQLLFTFLQSINREELITRLK